MKITLTLTSQPRYHSVLIGDPRCYAGLKSHRDDPDSYHSFIHPNSFNPFIVSISIQLCYFLVALSLFLSIASIGKCDRYSVHAVATHALETKAVSSILLEVHVRVRDPNGLSA